MISVPLKQTNEIDWVTPLKSYIRATYGDDPERYSEECATLNRLRQDMRGAGKDSAAGAGLALQILWAIRVAGPEIPSGRESYQDQLHMVRHKTLGRVGNKTGCEAVETGIAGIG